MSSFINGSHSSNLFYIKEINDKDKLITKILINLESKLKIVEQHKKKYYNNNKIRETIIINKYEFLDLLNEFEETITQSLQGMRSLITEIKNLKDKKEFENNFLKRHDGKINIKKKLIILPKIYILIIVRKKVQNVWIFQRNMKINLERINLLFKKKN